MLCNAIGAPVETKYINIHPKYLTMTKTHIIAAESEHVYSWQ